MTLHHEIGLKSSMQEGFSTFGTNAILVAFIQRGRKLFSKKYLMASVNSAPIISQLRLKKVDVKPSGPGALLSEIDSKACLISSVDIGCTRPALRIGGIVDG